MKITCVSAQGREVDTDLPSLLTPALRETARVEANQWIKRLRLVRYGALTMREQFTYRGDSLWWFTELYLHKMRRLDRAVALTMALEVTRERYGPAAIHVAGDDQVDVATTLAFGAAHGLPFVTAVARVARTSTAWQSYLIGLTARLSRWRPSAFATPAAHPAVAAFVHTAFWQAPDPQDEGYIGPVLDALARRCGTGDLFFVGVGPRRNFRARRWWDPIAPTAPTAAPIIAIERLTPGGRLGDSLALWRQRNDLARQVTSGDNIRDAARFRGCDLWPVLRRELEEVALLQWPWSARALDEAGAALDVLQPKTVLTYAEAGGWGRALMIEARRRNIPSAGLQHGFIYRHWLNYLHEPDEMAPLGTDRGFPRPDRTLVYDGFAANHLRDAGHFPDTTLAVTGSPRLDDLIARMTTRRSERASIRRQLGVTDATPLALLAAKFVEIRDLLPAVIDAAAERPGLHLIIKPHPAETPAVYAPLIVGRTNVGLAPDGLDLADLLVAADGLVTMNSTVAIDGLVLGLPALAVGLPNNLSPFVDAGVMLGVEETEKIGQGLEALLYDRQVRTHLAAAADPFVRHYGLAPDGHAAQRAADEILRMIQ